MSDLLHPPSLARTLKDAAARNASSAAAVADPGDADAAATRAALEACEKTAALLRKQLAPVDSDNTHDAPPPAKRRAVEREGAVVAAAVPSTRLASSDGGGADAGADGSGPGTEEAATGVINSTKSIHTQQPDGTWSTVVVPCKRRAAVVGAADRAMPGYHNAEVNILARMQDELRQEVLDFSQGRAARDLGRVRIASKAMHEAMMGSDLDLSHLEPQPSVAQLMTLGRGTVLWKFKQMPAEHRCSCAASRALAHMNIGEVSARGWEAIPDHERLVLGVGRSWRITKICLTPGVGVTLEELRALISCLNLVDTIAGLWLNINFNVSAADPTIGTLTRLTHLDLWGVSGTLAFVQNLVRLQMLVLSDTQVSGSLSFGRTGCHSLGCCRGRAAEAQRGSEERTGRR